MYKNTKSILKYTKMYTSIQISIQGLVIHKNIHTYVCTHSSIQKYTIFGSKRECRKSGNIGGDFNLAIWRP